MTDAEAAAQWLMPHLAELAVRWLMLFGTEKVQARRCFLGLKDERISIVDLGMLRNCGAVQYYSVTDGPDYFQMTDKGLEVIKNGHI